GEPVHIVEVHADDRAGRRDFVRAPYDRHEILDYDLPYLRVVQFDRPLGTAPSIAGRFRVRKTITVVPNVAVSAYVVDNQVDPGPEWPNEIFRIDVEPAHFAPRHRLIEAL